MFGASSLLVERLVTPQVPATLLAGPGWTTWLVVAVGVLAIAEVFRAGVNLRDLHERTI